MTPGFGPRPGRFTSQGYDPTERAFHLRNNINGAAARLDLHIAADPQHPLINPAFVIKNWGDADAVAAVDGARARPTQQVRFGHRRTLEGTDLVVWLKLESTKPTTVSIVPAR